MKYIRTKDGKILIAPNLYNNGGRVLLSDPPMYETRNAKNEWGCVFCHDVVKQADTIEELCDGYVVIDKGNYKTLVDNRQLAYDYLRGVEGWCKTKEVFGAIWTDKGLIYVAKMNEKGELELL